MKKCKCGKEIQDKYVVCMECAAENKQSSKDKYLEVLQQMNWNLGMISKTLQLLLPKEKLKELKELKEQMKK